MLMSSYITNSYLLRSTKLNLSVISPCIHSWSVWDPCRLWTCPGGWKPHWYLSTSFAEI